MYYFGTNLENRFSVPDFWPKPENTHRIPYDRDEIRSEKERLARRRLDSRARRLETDGGVGAFKANAGEEGGNVD